MAGETCPAGEYKDPELAELRLLSDVHHFLDYMDQDGNVSDDVFADVAQNKTTAGCEIAIPDAITTVHHKVTFEVGEAGARRATIWWLGNTAVQVYENGYKFHFSGPAHKRVAVEVSAAKHFDDNIQPGRAQSLIEPAMTLYDADPTIAKAEHLHDTDSIQVSTAIIDADGRVIGRKLRSLLIEHIKLGDWVAMLKDPNNIFDKSFDLNNERSALSVMELFSQMDLDEAQLPDGPINLVEAVVPYITDDLARQKVKRQVKRFRENQELYARESAVLGRDWALFDLELARSLKRGIATDDLHFFITRNNAAWSDESRQIIQAHDNGGTYYSMTTELAALLARAKQKLVGDNLCVIARNEAAIKEVAPAVRAAIRENHEALTRARAINADPGYIRVLEERQDTLLHGQKIDSGGGCPGRVASAFGDKSVSGGAGENDSPFSEVGAESDSSHGIIRCIKCRQYVPKADVVKESCWECPKCQHKVDVCTGATLREGVVSKPQQHRSARQLGIAPVIELFKISNTKEKIPAVA